MRKALIAWALLAVSCRSNQPEPSSSETGAAAGGAEGSVAGGVACGKNTCADGMVCCNASCGICTPPDSMCTQQACDETGASGETLPAEPPPNGGGGSDISCDNVRCAEGYHCEMVQVQCVTVPCNPVPECKPDAG